MCAFVAACRGSQPASQAVVIRDSAGVQIVENIAEAWGSDDAWRIGPVPLVDIGGDSADTTQQFLRVTRARTLENGDVALINLGARAILVFDSAGTFRRSIGRVGQGPGEYSALSDLYTCAGDTVIVNDGARVVVFSAEGQHSSTDRIGQASPSEALRVWGVTSDCNTYLLAASQYQLPPPGRSSRSTVRLHWGDLSAMHIDTIGGFSTLQVVTRTISGSDQTLALPWGSDLVWTLAADRMYIASSEVAEIRAYEPGRGLVLIIRWPSSAQAITAADRQLYDERRARWLLKFPQIAEVMPPLDQYPELPDRKPLLRAFHVDPLGNLWVRPYGIRLAGRPDRYDFQMGLWEAAPSSDPPDSWMVFDRSGRLLGSVQIPSDLDVKAVQEDRLIAVWKDDLDVEHVRWYEIIRGDG